MIPKASLFYGFDKLIKGKRDKKRIYPSKSTCSLEDSYPVFNKQTNKQTTSSYISYNICIYIS